MPSIRSYPIFLFYFCSRSVGALSHAPMCRSTFWAKFPSVKGPYDVVVTPMTGSCVEGALGGTDPLVWNYAEEGLLSDISGLTDDKTPLDIVSPVPMGTPTDQSTTTSSTSPFARGMPSNSSVNSCVNTNQRRKCQPHIRQQVDFHCA